MVLNTWFIGGLYMTVDEMKKVLEQYYESVGFAEFYDRALKGKGEEEIVKLYTFTFEQNQVLGDLTL